MIVIDKYNKLVNKAKKKRSRITETEKRLMVTSSCGGGGRLEERPYRDRRLYN